VSQRVRAASRRENALKRYREPNDPVLVDAIRQRRAVAAEEYIQRLLADTPPLTAEDKLHLTRLLTEPDRGSVA
jgi:hypothetical protein